MRAIGCCAFEAYTVESGLNDRVRFRMRRSLAVIVDERAADFGAVGYASRGAVISRS